MTAASWITVSRILFIPLFLRFLHSGAFRLALLLFLFLIWTDWLDGWIARKTGQVSNLGKWLDPLADKFLVLSTLVMMMSLGMVSVWPVIWLMLRELLVTAWRGGDIENERFMAANGPGKVKVGLEYGAILFFLFGWHGGELLLWLAVLIAIISAYPYWLEWKKREWDVR